jgi:hypothetical protein
MKERTVPERRPNGKRDLEHSWGGEITMDVVIVFIAFMFIFYMFEAWNLEIAA